MKSELLERLLANGQAYHVYFNQGLSNHLPMALIALHKLGGSDQQLLAFQQDYLPKLEKCNPADVEEIWDISEHLGQGDKFSMYLSYFQQQLAKQPLQICLQSVLPVLLPGIGASAFHGLIRLAYGIEQQNLNEVSFGLADWAAHYMPLKLSSEKSNKSMGEVLEELAPVARNHEFSPGLIFNRMIEISRLDKVQAYPVQPTEISQQELAALAVHAYAGSGDFTLLHGVTGCHALRLILPYCPDAELALRSFWQALLIAYLSTAGVEISSPPSLNNEAVDWSILKARVCNSKDDHQVKLMYTLWQESLVYSNSVYLALANRLAFG